MRIIERAPVNPVLRVVQFCLEIVALLGPALINQAPLVYPDTRSYFMGGHAAVMKVMDLFARHGNGGGGGGDSALDASMQKARGVRSAFYALFTYLPAVSVSLWLVIILQAIIVALMIRLTLRLLHPMHSPWQPTWLILLVAAFTTGSWVTCNVMPDVFTSIMALAILCVILFWDRLSRATALWLFIAIAGGVVMHTSNLLIAIGLLCVGFVASGAIWRQPARFVLVGCALVCAMLAMLVVGVVGFKQFTMTPQAPPFLLARSLSDGPARLYLQQHCPQIGLDMCKHLDDLDQTPKKFLWDDDGVYTEASPEEEALLRAEGTRIFLAAALEYPRLQLTAMVKNAFTQLINFGMIEYNIPSYASYSSDEITLHMVDDQPWHAPATWIEYAVVLFSIGYLIGFARKSSVESRRFVVMIAAVIILEAMIGAISVPAPRYEARVIWLIPLAAMLLHVRAIARRRFS